MGISKSVLIKALIKKKRKKKTVFLYQLCVLKIYFVLIHSRQILILPIWAVLINAIIKTGKMLALTVEGLSPLFRIERKSSCKFYTTIVQAQALGQSTEI